MADVDYEDVASARQQVQLAKDILYRGGEVGSVHRRAEECLQRALGALGRLAAQEPVFEVEPACPVGWDHV